MNNNKTKRLVIVALFTALVAVATMAIKVPTINGYIHLGDTMVYLCGIFLGPIYGAIAAGIGSFLADMLSGYMVWAVPSLLIKALDALAFGLIFKSIVLNDVKGVSLLSRYAFALIIGGSIMVGGYFITGTILYSFAGAIGSVIPNIVQAIGGGIIAYPILLALKKQKNINKIINK